MLGLVKEAVNRLIEGLGDRVVAVALFGSLARSESSERSDIDLLVVVRGMRRGMERRFTIYDIVHKMVRRDVTIIDVDEEELFKEDIEVPPLLINIAWDALVLHDPSGRLSQLFERVRTIVNKLNLDRYKTQDGKYGWKSSKPGRLKPVEV
ncbi:MAG: Nucleotidyltransferase domain protein [Candidatus Bathyarchaeota archaeon BA1]|nr:MAG: Nucleotidyltransferase domain protein [Candidatus Bathyarchaeota archaeon BA1]